MTPFDNDGEAGRFRTLLSTQDDLECKLGFIKALRKELGKASTTLDAFLLNEISRLSGAVGKAEVSIKKLEEIHKSLTAPPWHSARFVRWVRLNGDGSTRLAVVLCGNQRMAVSSGQVDGSALVSGDQVFLNEERNVLVSISPESAGRGGETVVFERLTVDGRIVVKSRDEEILVDAGGRLDCEKLTKGALLLWDRKTWLALEQVPDSAETAYWIEQTPSVRFEDIGGLDAQIEAVQRSIRLHLNHSDTARLYGLRRRGSVLLVGAPGTGKTMMAQGLANWLAGLAPTGSVHFMNIKPASLHSMWYGESERHYRKIFETARELAEREPRVPVVMFFDEVDSIGRRRGAASSAIDDRVQTAFMTELDGLEERGNILVVAATNRREALDPALLRPAGRLEVPRPNRSAAERIYSKYLTDNVPYSTSREDAVATGVSRIYAPNADTELARLTFRDGSERVLRASELISGAVIANIVQRALERACERHVSCGEEGLMPEDVVGATEEELVSLSASLTPSNCHHHLDGLTQDMDVVRVEPIVRSIPGPHDYVNLP